MQFQEDGPKDKQIRALESFGTKPLEFFVQQGHNAPLERWTIFLQRSSTSRTQLESSLLAELKYAFSAEQDVTIKKMMALKPLFIDNLRAWASRGIDHFILMQLHKPYAAGKFSIR